MNSGSISVCLAGPGDSLPKLSDFDKVCDALRACLNHIATCIVGKTVEYAVSELRTGSAVIGVEPVLNGVPPELTLDVSETFLRTIEDLELGNEVDRRLDFPAIRSFGGFAALARKEDVQVSISGRILTSEFVANVARLLEPASPTFGSVTGRLEAINLHRQSHFTLYTPMAGENVDCSFDRATLRQVLDAIGKRVTVFGKLYYAPAKSFPVKVEVDSFKMLPPDSELPSLLSLKELLPPTGSPLASWPWR